MSDQIDPKEFGEALKKRVSIAVVEAVDARIDKVADAYGKAAEATAKDEVKKAASELFVQLNGHIRDAERRLSDLARADDVIKIGLAENKATLALLDVSRVEAIMKHLHSDQIRIDKARLTLEGDLAGYNRNAEALLAVATELRAEDNIQKAVLTSLVGQINKIRDDTDTRVHMAAHAAASLAVEALTKDAVAKMAEASLAVTMASVRATDAVRKAEDFTIRTVEVRDAIIKAGQAQIDTWGEKSRDVLAKFTQDADRLSTELVQKADAALTAAAAQGDAQAADNQANPPLVPRAYRGPYRDGETYQRGDLVTYLGSTFIAVERTGARPLVSNDPDAPWQLFAAGGMGGGFTNSKKLKKQEYIPPYFIQDAAPPPTPGNWTTTEGVAMHIRGWIATAGALKFYIAITDAAGAWIWMQVHGLRA
jgi:hypothetical protein